MSYTSTLHLLLTICAVSSFIQTDTQTQALLFDPFSFLLPFVIFTFRTEQNNDPDSCRKSSPMVLRTDCLSAGARIQNLSYCQRGASCGQGSGAVLRPPVGPRQSHGGDPEGEGSLIVGDPSVHDSHRFSPSRKPWFATMRKLMDSR